MTRLRLWLARLLLPHGWTAEYWPDLPKISRKERCSIRRGLREGEQALKGVFPDA